MEPVTMTTVMVGAMVTRLLSPVIKGGWRKITNAEAKEEKKRIENSEREFKYKLELQRQSHEQRLIEAQKAHKLSLDKWGTQTYYERCWPLRNPFEMQICGPISDDKDSFDGNMIVPCRLISALKDKDHPYARTINGNLSSFIVTHYQTNSVHAVVSEIGAWKDDVPSNDASINYLYAGLKKQPVMVLSPTLINDGKTFIFKVWSWGLGEELNYPVGFEFGRLELQPLYIKAVYEETLKLVHLAQQMDYAPKLYSAKLQRNVSIIKDIQSKNATGKVREQMLSFLDTAPEINDAVKAKMESDISGIFCCISGMYADAYHLLEYKTLPKLPSLLPNIPGVEYMLPSLKNFYITLINSLSKIESDSRFLSDLYLDVADAFSSPELRRTSRLRGIDAADDVEPYLLNSLRLYASSENISDTEEKSLPDLAEEIQRHPNLLSSNYIHKYKEVCEKGDVMVFEKFD